MTFIDFFQSNIIFFVAGFGILAYLLFLELRGAKTRGLNLTPTEFTRRINDGAILIDLRRADEFNAGHIAGAKHISMDDLSNHFSGLPKDKPILLYCYSGSFSARAIGQMQKAGFTDVAHLGGGITAWQRDNLPTAKA